MRKVLLKSLSQLAITLQKHEGCGLTESFHCSLVAEVEMIPHSSVRLKISIALEAMPRYRTLALSNNVAWLDKVEVMQKGRSSHVIAQSARCGIIGDHCGLVVFVEVPQNISAVWKVFLAFDTTVAISSRVVWLDELEATRKTVTQVFDDLADIIHLIPAKWILAYKSAGGHSEKMR